MNFLNDKNYKRAFIVLIAYQFAIILYPGWQIDDTAFFLIRLKDNIFGNVMNTFSLSHGSDRFTPFYYFGYQLISFFTLKPFFFFLYNLFASILTLILLQSIRKKLSLDYWPFFLFIVFVPGFSDSFFQLVNPEKELILFWSIVLFAIISFSENRMDTIRSFFMIFIVLITMIFSIFMKETSFIIITSFGLSLLILNFKKILLYKQKFPINNKVIFIIYSGLILSFIFLVLFLNSYNHIQSGSYLQKMNPSDSFIGHIKSSSKVFILYAISDPLLVLSLPILFLYSVYRRVIQKKENFTHKMGKWAPFIDACAISALTLVSAYIVLGFHGYRYLLPVYPFGLIALTAYLQIYFPLIKKNMNRIYILVPSLLIVFLLVNSMLSSVNTAVFYKMSSYNFMQYKDALIHKIDDINSIKNTKVNFFLPGKKNIGYNAGRHRDILNFYEVNINSVNFEFNPINQNWIERGKKGDIENFVQKGDLFLITPNSTISQDQIMANLQGLKLREIMRTQSPNYFEIPEIRHFLKYLMLQRNPDALVHQMIYREVDFAIYQVI